MKRPCPICKRDLTQEHKIEFIDYHCSPPMPDHHYSERLKDGQVLILKARLSPIDSKKKLFFKIHFVDKYTEVWDKADPDERVKINQTFKPDFNNIEALKSKLRTYVIFS